MNVALLIPVAVIALPAFIWAAKIWIEQVIQRRVSSAFDKELEGVRSDLRLKEAEIAALQATALGSSAGRQAILDKRRMEAVEEVWAASIRIRQLFSMAVMSLRIFKIDAIAKRAVHDAKVREMVTMMRGGDHKDKLADPLVERQRPFVSATVWSTFSAYRTVLLFAYIQIEMISTGIEDIDKLSDGSKMVEMIKAVLPHQSKYLDDHGTNGVYWLTEELAEKLHTDIQNMIDGREADQSDLDRASKILRLAGQIQNKAEAASPI